MSDNVVMYEASGGGGTGSSGAGVILVNFSHPISAAQLEQIAGMLHVNVSNIAVTTIKVEMDLQAPFSPQVDNLFRQLPEYLDTRVQVLINMPGLAPVAAMLTPLLLDYFSNSFKLIRLTSVSGSAMTSYEVFELIDI